MDRRVFGPLQLGLRCDLWCLVLRPRLEPVPPEYQPFDRVMSSSIRVTVVNLLAMKGYEGEIAVFIFKILVGLSGQLRAPANLATRKYSPVSLAVERRLSGSPEAVWTICRRDKYVAPNRNRTTVPEHCPVAGHYARGVQTDGSYTL